MEKPLEAFDRLIRTMEKLHSHILFGAVNDTIADSACSKAQAQSVIAFNLVQQAIQYFKLARIAQVEHEEKLP